MTQPAPPPASPPPTDPRGSGSPAESPARSSGSGSTGARAQLRRAKGFLLERVRESWVLRITMAVALLCYGGIPMLVVWQENGVSRLDFQTAGVLVAMSLASWCFLFWWYPVLARTADHLGASRDDNAGLTRALEMLAIACVVIVHALLAFIMLHRAGGG